jgi:hypothetical protein
MNIRIRGLEECIAGLEELAAAGPDLAVIGVRAGLESMQTVMEQNLKTTGQKVRARGKGKVFKKITIGRRAVAAVFPGLHKIGWILVTGIGPGGSSKSRQRKRFATKRAALKAAREYAGKLVEEQGAIDLAITVSPTTTGAYGTLTSAADDDINVQAAWDRAQRPAQAAAEAAIVARLGHGAP